MKTVVGVGTLGRKIINMVKEEQHKNNDITFISYDTDAEEKIDVKNGVISKELSETVDENLYLMNSEELIVILALRSNKTLCAGESLIANIKENNNTAKVTVIEVMPFFYEIRPCLEHIRKFDGILDGYNDIEIIKFSNDLAMKNARISGEISDNSSMHEALMILNEPIAKLLNDEIDK